MLLDHPSRHAHVVDGSARIVLLRRYSNALTNGSELKIFNIYANTNNHTSQFAAMQREIDDLRRRLQLATGNDESPSGSVAIAAPPDLAPPATPSTTTQRLGEVSIDGVVLDDLFKLWVLICGISIILTDNLGTLISTTHSFPS